MTLHHRWLLGLLILFAGPSSAATYYWSFFWNPGVHFSSLSAACQSETSTVTELVSYTPGVPNQYAGTCYMRRISDGYQSSIIVDRYGDSCPSGSTYNTSTGACDAPVAGVGELCEDQSGGTARDPKVGNTDGSCKNVTQSDQAAKCQYLAKNRPSQKVKFRVTDWQKEAGSSTAPSAGFVSTAFGCEVQVLEGSKCTYEPPRPSMAPGLEGAMEPGVHSCTADVVVTGAVNNLNADPAGMECLLNPDACEIPDPTQQTDFKPCAYAYDTDGQRGTCQSIKVDWNSESESCDYVGTVNGQSACIGKKPTSNGIVIDTEIKTTPNADGSTTTTKTDKATQTVCNGSGLNSCQTLVTNNKTTVVKNGAGDVVSENSTCTGANCPTGSNPDGNGDGLGDCTGDDCGEEEEGGGTEVAMPELEEVDGYKETVQKFFDRASDAPIVQAVTGLSLAENSSCPVFSADLGPLGFQNTAIFCELAPSLLLALRAALLAVYAWLAVRLFMMA